MTIDVLLSDSWLYTLSDYRRAFKLTDSDLNMSLLELPASLSSFNMQATQVGSKVVTASPLFTCDKQAVKNQLDEWLETAFVNLQVMVDSSLITPDESRAYWRLWQRIAKLYLIDYSIACDNRRYQFSGNTALPFPNQHFQLALCVNDNERIGTSFCERVWEALRVANEVRIFPIPLIDDGLFLAGFLSLLHEQKIAIAFEQVPSFFGLGESTLCRLWHTECEITEQT